MDTKSHTFTLGDDYPYRMHIKVVQRNLNGKFQSKECWGYERLCRKKTLLMRGKCLKKKHANGILTNWENLKLKDTRNSFDFEKSSACTANINVSGCHIG